MRAKWPTRWLAAGICTVAALAACAGSENGDDGGSDDESTGAAAGAGSGTGSGAAAGGPTEPETGVCADACPKGCDVDNDCDTSQGELCCSFGEHGSACTKAAECPRFCDSDASCDSQKGEACLRSSLLSKQKTCISPAEAIRLCQSDAACGAGEECCTIYDEPVCLPTGMCPKSCSQSNQCGTQFGEVCCTTFAITDQALSAPGLCVDTAIEPCPGACTTSSDCNTQNGEICCDGICSTSCPKSCTSSNECSAQICCKTPALQSPFAKGAAPLGYHAAPPVELCPPFLQGDGYCDEPSPCPPGSDPDCNGSGCATCSEVLAGSPEPACPGSMDLASLLASCACSGSCATYCCGGSWDSTCETCLDAFCSAEYYACITDA